MLTTTILVVNLNGKKLLIPEAILEKEICSVLGVQGHELTKDLVARNLISLELNNVNLRDLRGLEVATNLEVLILKDNLIQDLTPISKLPKLRKLDLTGNRIQSLSSLTQFPFAETKSRILEIQNTLKQPNLSDDFKASLILEISELSEKFKLKNTSLIELNLANNRLLGISGIEMFNGISWLNLSNNSLIDLEGLSNLKSLKTLYLQKNQLGRVEEYEDVNRNKEYDLGEPIVDQSGNGKRDTNPLVEIKSLPNLRYLYLYDNMIKTFTGINDLPVISVLLLSGNSIETIREIKNLSSLERLSLNSNFIYDLSGLQDLINLKHLDLTENRICDLRPVSSLKRLKELRLQSNHISDISPLSSLQYLETLSLSKNLIYDPYPINNFKSLRILKLSENSIDIENPRFESMVLAFKNSGCSTDLRNQNERSFALENLVLSLASFSSSNRDLGRFLQEEGYLRFTDFIQDPKIDLKTKESLYSKWDNSFKKGLSSTDLEFLDK